MRSRPSARPCRTCLTGTTIRPEGICQPCARSAEPTRFTCQGCGNGTISQTKICNSCAMYYKPAAFELANPDPKLSLGEGDWRFDPFRRVQVWVPAPVVQAWLGRKPGPMPVDVPDEEARKFACDHCGVAAGELCVRPDGTKCYSETHRARRVSALKHLRTPEPTEAEEKAPDVSECAHDRCGAWFVKRDPRQIYCDERCRASAYHFRHRARKEEAA